MKSEPKMPKPWKHPTTGAYYLNQRIPSDLISSYSGKRHIQKSLGTKDRKEADKRLCEEWLKLQRQFELKRSALRNTSPLEENLADLLGQRWLSELLTEDDELRIEEGHLDKTLRQSEEAIEWLEKDMRNALARGQSEAIEDELDDWLLSNGFSFEKNSTAYKKTAYAFLKAFVRHLEIVRKRNQGDGIDTPIPPPLPQSLRLKAVMDMYLDGKSKSTEMGRKTYAALAKFGEVIGEERPVASIKQADVLEFFDIVQHLPSERGGRKRPPGVPIRQLVANEVTMAPATFENNYVAPIRTFLRWAISTYQDQGFPVGLTTDYIEYKGARKEGDQKQRALETHELKRLFEGCELKAFAADPHLHHRYWLPVVGLHTGARINELCQINPHVDVFQHEDVWVLHVTADSATDERVTKSVKTGKSRYIPVHPKLIELGFLAYVDKIKASGHKLLFPGFKPKRGKASAQAAEWFGAFLKEIGVRDETPGKRIAGAHAFRSTLITYAANHSDPSLESRIGLITGHIPLDKSTTKVMRGYITKRTMETLHGIIEQIDFGLDIPFPTQPHPYNT